MRNAMGMRACGRCRMFEPEVLTPRQQDGSRRRRPWRHAMTITSNLFGMSYSCSGGGCLRRRADETSPSDNNANAWRFSAAQRVTLRRFSTANHRARAFGYASSLCDRSNGIEIIALHSARWVQCAVGAARALWRSGSWIGSCGNFRDRKRQPSTI